MTTVANVDLSNMPLAHFMSGVAMATFAASGLFFFKFWRKTGEGFFFWFGITCWLLALERVPLLFMLLRERSLVYLFRLAGFIVILIAIIRLNRKAKAR